MKRIINIQRFFLLIFLVIIFEIALNSYFPWIKAIYTGDFTSLKALKLNLNDDNFNKLFIVNSIRLISVVLIVISFLLYNKFLVNIKSKFFFTNNNSRLLIRASYFLTFYAFINYILNYLDIDRNYFNNGNIMFIALTSYTFGTIFKKASEYKAENDLTI